MKYLDQQIVDEAHDASRAGVTLDVIAGHLQISVGELRQVMNLPKLQPTEHTVQEPTTNFWTADKQNEVLS